jgi:hypothetical protein
MVPCFDGNAPNLCLYFDEVESLSIDTGLNKEGKVRCYASREDNHNNNLTLINTPGIPTWQSKSGQQSIIDLTFTNAPTSNYSIIKEWQVNHELSFTSDHFPIMWTIDQGRQPTNTPSNNPRYNLKETKTKK